LVSGLAHESAIYAANNHAVGKVYHRDPGKVHAVLYEMVKVHGILCRVHGVLCETRKVDGVSCRMGNVDVVPYRTGNVDNVPCERCSL
jgi:hypothetical protein